MNFLIQRSAFFYNLALRNQLHKLVRMTKTQNSQVRSATEGTSIAVLPASSPGSLGDDAMLKGLSSYLIDKGVTIKPIAYNPEDIWEFMDSPIATLPELFGDWSEFSRKLEGVHWIFINGADVIDGTYSLEKSLRRLKLAYIANFRGIPVTITGFSIKPDIPGILKKAISGLPPLTDLNSRDVDSYHRLKSFAGERANLVADLAFLMPPNLNATKKKKYYKWIDLQRKNAKRLLAINICAHSLTLADPVTVQGLLDVYTSALDTVLEQHENLSILIVPHDTRGFFSDTNLGVLLNSLLQDKYPSRVSTVDGPLSADEIKALAGLVDAAFTGRMHFGIAALGMGKPVSCFSYQGKFSGLFKIFDLDEKLILEYNPSCTTKLIEAINSLLCNTEAYSDSIKESIESVKADARSNFSRFEHHVYK